MSKPSAPRAASFKEFLKTKDRPPLDLHMERIAQMVARRKSYEEIADKLKLTPRRVMWLADRIARVIRLRQVDLKMRVQHEELMKKLPQMLPEHAELSIYLSLDLAHALREQGIQNGAELREAFDKKTLVSVGPEEIKQIKEFLRAMEPSRAPHVITFESAFESHSLEYVTMGELPSLAAAIAWLSANGFEESPKHTHLWIKNSDSQLCMADGVTISVRYLQAWVKPLRTVEQVRFIPDKY